MISIIFENTFILYFFKNFLNKILENQIRNIGIKYLGL